MPLLRYLFFFVFLFLHYIINAQEINFININTDHGLPANECYRIVQDKQGYIWVSTEMGLAKYNGKDFILFDASRGLPYKNIYGLDADSSGRVWFATGDWKVGYILDDKVKMICDETNFSNPLTNYHYKPTGDVVYKMKYMESENAVYISNHALSYRIIEYEGKWYTKNINANLSTDFLLYYTNKTELAYVFNSSDTNNFYKKFSGYRKDYKLTSNKNNFLFLLNNNPNTSIKNEIFNFSNSQKNYFSFQNSLYILEKESIVPFFITENDILSFFVTRNELKIIGIRHTGLQLLNANNSVFNLSLKNLSPSNIIQDNQGNMWITTLENGIYFCSNLSIKNLQSTSNDQKAQNCIVKINDKLVLSNANKIRIFSKRDGKEEVLILPRKSEITDIAFFRDKYIIGSLRGLFLLNKSFKFEKEIKVGNEAIGILGISHAKEKNKLSVHSIVTFWKLNKKFELEFQNLPVTSKIRNTIFLRSDSALCLTKKSLELFNLSDKHTSLIKEIQRNTFDAVKVCADQNENFWLIGSSDSLLIFNTAFLHTKTIILNTKNLLCRNILQINKLSFLVSTNKGLCNINFTDTTYEKYSYTFFDETNGLNSSDIYNVVPFNNEYYVSTSKGVCTFNKIEDLHHISPPNTIISKITVDDKQISQSSGSSFTYHENNFAFTIDALTYKKTFQKGVFYKYKLEGFDNDYKNADGYTITYTNLPPGNYTFLAKAFYDNATEDDTPAKYSFTIKPAFWQTWWGISLIVLSIGALIFYYIKKQIDKIEKREKEKALTQQTIAEYKLTALKAQMNPHFVFNSINVIQNLILEKDKQEAYNSLTTFSKLIRKILNQSDSVYSTVEEELELINSYVNLNKLRVDYPFEYYANVQPNALQCYIPSLIIQPFIENALWHGILPLKGSKVGIIKLTISLINENILQVIIQDNGVGRKATENNKTLSSNHISKGMQLIKERLEVYRTLNNNCIAELNITDVDEDNFKGTFVELKIEINEELQN